MSINQPVKLNGSDYLRNILPRNVPLYLCVLLLSLLPCPAYAIADCIVSATNVAFGNYTYSNPMNTHVTGNIQVSCSLLGIISLLVSYDILLSTGDSSSYAPRKMHNGSNQLQYNLFTNAARTIVWGDGNSGTAKVSDNYLLGIGTTVRNYSLYGSIPASQNTSAGSYSDTIIVTVNF